MAVYDRRNRTSAILPIAPSDRQMCELANRTAIETQHEN
jgi:hypothetical protein